MYYNILSELKNAYRARKEKTTFPFSKMDWAVLKVLAEHGYVKSIEKETAGRKNIISVRLAYPNKVSALNDFKIISKPSRHFYADHQSLQPIKQGHGVGLVSTSKGIMTTVQARKNKIGGEYLFDIW